MKQVNGTHTIVGWMGRRTTRTVVVTSSLRPKGCLMWVAVEAVMGNILRMGGVQTLSGQDIRNARSGCMRVLLAGRFGPLQFGVAGSKRQCGLARYVGVRTLLSRSTAIALMRSMRTDIAIANGSACAQARMRAGRP